MKKILNKKVSILASLFAFVLISVGSTSAFALTLKNELKEQVTYDIATDMGKSVCEIGTLQGGQTLKWKWVASTACPVEPQHVEVRVDSHGIIPFKTWCTPEGSYGPYAARVLLASLDTISSGFLGKAHCYTTKEE